MDEKSKYLCSEMQINLKKLFPKMFMKRKENDNKIDFPTRSNNTLSMICKKPVLYNQGKIYQISSDARTLNDER